jgi:hypothetical protein
VGLGLVLAAVLGAGGAAAQAVDEPGADTASSAPASLAAPAGVNGQIVAPGRCPVPLGGDGPACPDRPFATTVLILTPDSQQTVASVPTAADGTFAVALQPGRYLVDPLLGDGTSPAASSVVVDVPGDILQQLTIRVQGGHADLVTATP